MSFCQNIKEKIASAPPHKPCCRKAMLYGMMAVRARTDGQEIRVKLEGEQAVSTCLLLLSQVYHAEGTVHPLPGRGKPVEISFNSSTAEKYLSDSAHVYDFSFCRCETCRSYFFRGLFLACGRVSDPRKEYRLELQPLSHIETLTDIFRPLHMSPHVGERRGMSYLYFRRGEDIADFFGLPALNDIYFEVVNTRITNEMRSAVNRIANCETNNIEKAVSASMRQIETIERLARDGKLSLLPDKLKETAELRLRHRDLSLTALAAVASPPLTKSGLNHRLQKIMEFAAEIEKRTERGTE